MVLTRSPRGAGVATSQPRSDLHFTHTNPQIRQGVIILYTNVQTLRVPHDIKLRPSAGNFFKTSKPLHRSECTTVPHNGEGVATCSTTLYCKRVPTTAQRRSGCRHSPRGRGCQYPAMRKKEKVATKAARSHYSSEIVQFHPRRAIICHSCPWTNQMCGAGAPPPPPQPKASNGRRCRRCWLNDHRLPRRLKSGISGCEKLLCTPTPLESPADRCLLKAWMFS